MPLPFLYHPPGSSGLKTVYPPTVTSLTPMINEFSRDVETSKITGGRCGKDMTRRITDCIERIGRLILDDLDADEAIRLMIRISPTLNACVS